MGIGFEKFQNAFVNNPKGLDDKYFVKDGDGLALHEKTGFFGKSVQKNDQNEMNYGLRQQFLNAMRTKLQQGSSALENDWFWQLRDELGLDKAGNSPKELSARLVSDHLKGLKTYEAWKNNFNAKTTEWGMTNEKYKKGFEEFVKLNVVKTINKKEILEFSKLPEWNQDMENTLKNWLGNYAKNTIFPSYKLPSDDDLDSELGEKIEGKHTKALTEEQRTQLGNLKKEMAGLRKMADGPLGTDNEIKEAIANVVEKYVDLYVERNFTKANFNLQKYASNHFANKSKWNEKDQEQKADLLGRMEEECLKRMKEEIKKDFGAKFSEINTILSELKKKVIGAVARDFATAELKKENKKVDDQNIEEHIIEDADNPVVENENDEKEEEEIVRNHGPLGKTDGAKDGEISEGESEFGSEGESFAESLEENADGNEVVVERRSVPGAQNHDMDSLSEKQKELFETLCKEANKFFNGDTPPSSANLATMLLRKALEEASKKEGNDVDVMKMQKLFWNKAVEAYGKDKVSKDKLAFVDAIVQGKSYERALDDMNKVANQQAQEIPKRIDPNFIRRMDPNAGVGFGENHVEAQAEQNQIVSQEENILEENNGNVDEQPQPIQNNIRGIRQRVEEMQAPVNGEEQVGNPQVKSFKSNTVLAAYRSLLDQIPAQGAGDGGSLDSDLEKNFGGRNVNWLKQGQPLALSREEPRIPSAVKDYFMKDEANGLRAANCLGMLLKQDTLTQLEQDRRESTNPAGNELEFENQARDYRVKRTATGAYEIEVLVEASVSKIKGGGANGQDLLLDPAQSKIKYSTKYVLTFGQDGKPQLDMVGETEVDFQKTEAQLSQTQMNTLRNFMDPDTNEELGKNAVWELSALNNDDFKKALDDLAKPEITANEEQLTATRKRVAEFLRENTITERDKTLLRGLGLGRQEMERLIRGRIPGAHLTKAHLKNFYSEVVEERREALAQLKELQKKQEETKWIIHENLLDDRIALTVEGGVKGSYDELFSDLRLTWDFLDDANVDDEKKTNIRNVITGLGDKNATDEVKKQHLDTLNQFLVDQRKSLGFNYLHAFQKDFSTRQIEILKEHFNSAQDLLKREIEENMQQLYDQKDDASVRNAIDKLQTSIQAYAQQHGEVLVAPEDPGQNGEEQHLQLNEQNQAAA